MTNEMTNETAHDHGSHHHGSPDHGSQPPFAKWAFIGFLLVGGFFLFTEHRAHLFGILPYLLLAACPLMHIFGHGHGGHGHHHGGHGPAQPPAVDREASGQRNPESR